MSLFKTLLTIGAAAAIVELLTENRRLRMQLAGTPLPATGAGHQSAPSRREVREVADAVTGINQHTRAQVHHC